MGGLYNLNQSLIRGLTSCLRVFGGRDHFSASLTLLAFVNNVSLLNPSLDPVYTGWVFTSWLKLQGTVEASTCRDDNASLLLQQLDG